MADAWIDLTAPADKAAGVERDARMPLRATLIVSALFGLATGLALSAGGVGIFWSVVAGWLALNAAPLLLSVGLILCPASMRAIGRIV